MNYPTHASAELASRSRDDPNMDHTEIPSISIESDDAGEDDRG